jgi:hypothetical protein
MKFDRKKILLLSFTGLLLLVSLVVLSSHLFLWSQTGWAACAGAMKKRFPRFITTDSVKSLMP